MNKKGFTLFELLVSISIIGILIAVASMSFSSAQKKARDARRMEDMGAISKAAESYYSLSTTYTYPLNTNPWVASTGETILPIFPTDPKGVGWTAYNYSTVAGASFCACAAVENVNNGNSTTNACAFASGGAFYCIRNQQ